MPRKKKPGKDARRREDGRPILDDDSEIKNPGDCFGNYLEGDSACEICEIQDTCRQMTEEMK